MLCARVCCVCVLCVCVCVCVCVRAKIVLLSHFLLLELPLARCLPLLLLPRLLLALLLHLELLLPLVLEEGAHQSTHPCVEVRHGRPHLLALSNWHLEWSPEGREQWEQGEEREQFGGRRDGGRQEGREGCEKESMRGRRKRRRWNGGGIHRRREGLRICSAVQLIVDHQQHTIQYNRQGLVNLDVKDAHCYTVDYGQIEPEYIYNIYIQCKLQLYIYNIIRIYVYVT